MRVLRRAFVVTVAAACARPVAPPPEPTRNPPPPEPEPVVVATNPPMPDPAALCPPREALRAGEACAPEGRQCYTPTGGCQPPGFTCTDGRWREVWVTCNPPPPPR